MTLWKIRLLGISLFSLLTVLTLQFCSPKIQADLHNKTISALQKKNHHWADVQVDGQKLTLSGTAPTNELKYDAEETVRDLWGATDVTNNIGVAEPVSPYSMNVEYDGHNLSVSGYVQNQATLKELQEKAHQEYGKSSAQLDLQYAAGQPAHWSMVSRQLLEHIKQLNHAKLEIKDQLITVRGNSPSIESKQHLQKQLASFRDRGYELVLNINAPPPEPTCQEKFDRALSSSKIQFLPNDSTVSTNSLALLTKLGQIGKSCPNAQITVAGHTDNVGNETANQELSYQRALAVAQHLIQKGIDSNRLKTIGFGETRPIVSNKTPKGRSTNRRIEFIIEGTEEA